MIGFYTKFATAEENRDKLAALLSEAAEGMDAIPECRMYVVSKDADNAALIWVTELWDSKEAHQASLKRESARKLIAEAMPLMSGKPEQIVLDPVAGKGI